MRFLVFSVQATLLFFAATFVFDCVHWALHRCARSRSQWLRAVASLHLAHHEFLGPDLQPDDRFLRGNLFKHALPEYGTQVAVIATGFLVLDSPAVVLALAIATFQSARPVARRGRDPNHRPLTRVMPPPHRLLVSPAYHALHHVYPDRYFGSYTALFDRLMGTACQLRGKRVVLTGASGALGAPLRALLEREGVAHVDTPRFGVDYGYGDYERLAPVLERADVLVLAHGSKHADAMAANCDSFVALIERFKALTVDRRLPPEVWAVGSEIEAYPAFGIAALAPYLESKRAFARHARRYYRDDRILYRHIVPSAFRSRMGGGLLSGEAVARVTMFLIRRGFRYVPVTYTGVALWNYLKFMFHRTVAPPPRQPSRG
jgi:hypothetical protein